MERSMTTVCKGSFPEHDEGPTKHKYISRLLIEHCGMHLAKSI